KGTNGTVLWEETDVCEGFQFNKLSLANISLDATLDFIIVSSEKLKVIDGSSRLEIFSKIYNGNSIVDYEVAEMTGDNIDDIIISCENSIEVVNGLGLMVWTSTDFGGFFCTGNFTGDSIPDISNGIDTLDGKDGTLFSSLLLTGQLTAKPVLIGDFTGDSYSELAVDFGKELLFIDVVQSHVMDKLLSDYHEISNVLSLQDTSLVISTGRAIKKYHDIVEPHLQNSPVIIFPNGGEIVNGTITITWSAVTDIHGHLITYQLYHSSDNGFSWELLADLINNSYGWNTENTNNGFDHRLKVVAICEEGMMRQDLSDGVFTISNIEHVITEPAFIYPSGGETLTGTVLVEWTEVSDTKGHAVEYTLLYSMDGGTNWNIIIDDLTVNNYYWDTTTVADGSNYLLKVRATCSEGLSSEGVIDNEFTIINQVTSTTTTTTTSTSTTTDVSSTSTSTGTGTSEITFSTPSWTVLLLLIPLLAITLYRKKQQNT
ncbi:MAG: hypothetical protein ACTSRU_17970, partial [Candidatus Hodarchaeales archaeon]